MKPSNVLLNTECDVKICDFGLARSIAEGREEKRGRQLTEYVATRWYRAPEILLGSRVYTKGVDMWSIGCILGEMIAGQVCDTGRCGHRIVTTMLCAPVQPMFPGSSTANQLELIIEFTGVPSEEDQRAIRSAWTKHTLDSLLYEIVEEPDGRRRLGRQRAIRRRTVDSMFPGAPPDALDLISKLLHFNPEKRLSAQVG